MGKKVFLVVGQPSAASAEARLLAGRAVGDRLEDDFSNEEKRGLVDSGVVREVDESASADDAAGQADAAELAPDPAGLPAAEQPGPAVDSPVPGAGENEPGVQQAQ